MVHEVPPSLSRNVRSITILYNLRLKHPQKKKNTVLLADFHFFYVQKRLYKLYLISSLLLIT